jgi:hypothetical protein
MEPPPPPGPPPPVGPPGTEPPPPPGPPLPVGPLGTEPPPEVSPGADDVGAGVVLVVELVVVVVVVLLLVEPPLPPPHPTASVSIATPPSSAIVTLGSDFISYPLSPCCATDTRGAVARNSPIVRGALTAKRRQLIAAGRSVQNIPSGSPCRAGFSGWLHRTRVVTNVIRASIRRSTYAGSDDRTRSRRKACRITNRQDATNMRNGRATR